jgi:hypothetical protein
MGLRDSGFPTFPSCWLLLTWIFPRIPRREVGLGDLSHTVGCGEPDRLLALGIFAMLVTMRFLSPCLSCRYVFPISSFPTFPAHPSKLSKSLALQAQAQAQAQGKCRDESNGTY